MDVQGKERRSIKLEIDWIISTNGSTIPKHMIQFSILISAYKYVLIGFSYLASLDVFSFYFLFFLSPVKKTRTKRCYL